MGDLPIFVPIFFLNSGSASPFGARGEDINLYGRCSSSRSHTTRIAREAPKEIEDDVGVVRHVTSDILNDINQGRNGGKGLTNQVFNAKVPF